MSLRDELAASDQRPEGAKHPAWKRIDLDDPETIRLLTESGRIWKFPRYLWPHAIDAIESGIADYENCIDVPYVVAAYLFGTEDGES